MRIGVLKSRRVALGAALVLFSQEWVRAASTNAVSSRTVAVAPRFSTNALISARIKWNLDTLIPPYLDQGHHDALWDEPVTNAMILFARMRSDPALTNEADRIRVVDYCKQARSKGCQ